MLEILLSRSVTARSPANSTSEEYGYFSSNNLTSSMLTMVILVIALFFLFGFVSVYIRQCAGEHVLGVGPDTQTPNRNRRSTKGLDPATVAKFPIMVYSEVKEHQIGKQALECAVCLSEFEDGEKLRLLPKCSHVFHPDCIGAWLSGHATCPVCRSNLTDCKIGEIHTPMSPNPNTSTAIATDRQPDVMPVPLPADAVVVEVQENPLPLRLFASHSTGHSLASLPRTGYTPDRYTLKLPSHVLHQIIADGEHLRRCASSRGGEGSSGRGGRGRIRMFVRDVLSERLWGIGSTTVRGVGVGVGGSVRGRLESVKGEFEC